MCLRSVRRLYITFHQLSVFVQFRHLEAKHNLSLSYSESDFVSYGIDDNTGPQPHILVKASKTATMLIFANALLNYMQGSYQRNMQGSYQSGNTASRPISEVKHSWVSKVLAWETSLEPVMILRFFGDFQSLPEYYRTPLVSTPS